MCSGRAGNSRSYSGICHARKTNVNFDTYIQASIDRVEMEKINTYRKWKSSCIFDQKSFSNIDSILHKRKPGEVWCRNIYARCNAENNGWQEPKMQ